MPYGKVSAVKREIVDITFMVESALRATFRKTNVEKGWDRGRNLPLVPCSLQMVVGSEREVFLWKELNHQ